MTKSAFAAEQFVRQLEALLHTARAAAAALETEVTTSSERLTLFSFEAQLRNGTQSYVVQLQAGEALYEGTAAQVDFAETRPQVAARAALAALAEWSGDQWQFGLGDVLHVSLNCGPAVVVTVALRPAPRRPDIVARVPVLAADRVSAPGHADGAQLSKSTLGIVSSTAAGPASASVRVPVRVPDVDSTAAPIHASSRGSAHGPTDGRGMISFIGPRPGAASERWLLGSALQWDDPAEAAVHAVLDAIKDVEVASETLVDAPRTGFPTASV